MTLHLPFRFEKQPMIAAFLITVGCLQMTGDVLGLEAVKAVGAMTHASPAPKVFTSQSGYETFSATFRIDAFDARGRMAASVLLTPEVNARMAGPYNRRNAYGAAISYGPVLYRDPRTREMFESVLAYAFCRPRSRILRELELPTDSDIYRIRIRPAARVADQGTAFYVFCPNKIGGEAP